MSSQGTISGVPGPLTAGSYTFSITATAGSKTLTAYFKLTVVLPSATFGYNIPTGGTIALTDADLSQVMSIKVHTSAAIGGAVSWEMNQPGNVITFSGEETQTLTLGISPTATLSANTVYPFTLSVKDWGQDEELLRQDFTYTPRYDVYNEGDPLVMTLGGAALTDGVAVDIAHVLPAALVGGAISPIVLGINNNTGSLTWASRGLPAGLSLSATGTITGTPSVVGSYPFSITTVDASKRIVTRYFKSEISQLPVLTFDVSGLGQVADGSYVLPSACVGVTYNYPIHATGGSGQYYVLNSFDSNLSGLPGGVTVSQLSLGGTDLSSGYVTGIPENAGTFKFKVTAIDRSDPDPYHPTIFVTQTFTLVVNPGIVIEKFGELTAKVGVPFDLPFKATGGSGGYLWNFQTASVTIFPSGWVDSLTIRPSTAGTFSFVISVRDKNNSNLSAIFPGTQILTVQ